MTNKEKQPSKARQSISRRTQEADRLKALAARPDTSRILRPFLRLEEFRIRPLPSEIRLVERTDAFVERSDERINLSKQRNAARLAKAFGPRMPVELEKAGSSVISVEKADELYRRGVKTRRSPEPKLAPNGLDLNSWHFRGVTAAWDVIHTFPREVDPSTERELPLNPSALEAHLASGLEEIRGMGSRRLADEFVGGYEGWASLAVRDSARALDRQSSQS